MSVLRLLRLWVSLEIYRNLYGNKVAPLRAGIFENLTHLFQL